MTCSPRAKSPWKWRSSSLNWPTRPDPTKLYRIAYEGTISDEPRFAVLGGDAETIKARFEAAEDSLESLGTTLPQRREPPSLVQTGPLK